MGIFYLVFLRINAATALRQVRCVCDDAIPTSGDLMRVTLHLSGLDASTGNVYVRGLLHTLCL